MAVEQIADEDLFDWFAGQTGTDPADAVLTDETVEHVLALVSDNDREILTLAVINDLSGERIAQELGIKPGAARVRLSRALNRLRAAMKDAGVYSGRNRAMSEQHDVKMLWLGREKMLYRYCSALDRADFEDVADILREAEDDAELSRMISEANTAYAGEYEVIDVGIQADAIRRLLAQHFPDSVAESGFTEVPPISIGDVAARLQSDCALKGMPDCEAQAMILRLYETKDTLPADLSPLGVQEMFAELGLRVSRRFQDLFRRTAIYLKIGREQSMVSLAAARRQRRSRNKRRPENYEEGR